MLIDDGHGRPDSYRADVISAITARTSSTSMILPPFFVYKGYIYQFLSWNTTFSFHVIFL